MTTNTDFGTGQYAYGANGKSYGYDANGNMTARNGHTLGYDGENRLIGYDSGAAIIDFGYAEGGARLWKQNLSTGGLQVWVGEIHEEKRGALLLHRARARQR